MYRILSGRLKYPPPGRTNPLYRRTADRTEHSSRAARPTAINKRATVSKPTPESGSAVLPADGIGVGATVGDGSVGLLGGVSTGVAVATGDGAALGRTDELTVGIGVGLGRGETVGEGGGTRGLGGTQAGSTVKRTTLCST